MPEAAFGGKFTMAKTTISLGVVLILLGTLGFISTGSHAPTALIPAIVGIILSILGLLALTDDAKKRMLYMHIAVTIGLLGFLGTFWSIVNYVQMIRGRQFPHPVAVEEKAAMAAVLLLFVLLSVRSFIAARRERAA
jgi:multisubunit Na+/H+ antiporter MnhF subunit